ncbi:MAG: class I SAM-dependent methyltransferase [Deltaproteobacteria bacterium]|nr:class I SAM-dependent methyltransferase [Deltaproteobacteria bacterium]
MPHKFEPTNIELLINNDRIKELNPVQFLRENGLQEGMCFADIGCGPGFFSIPAAHIIGDKGMVYAIDIQEEMVNKLKQRRPPENLKIIISQENTIPLENTAVDFALLAFVLHETEDRIAFLKEAKRCLRPQSILLVVEWEKKIEDKGPPFEERIERDEAEKLIEAAGFKIQETASLNPSHYKIKARK